jgi:hypothetical protein
MVSCKEDAGLLNGLIETASGTPGARGIHLEVGIFHETYKYRFFK